jgi:hypothetical protein
MSCWKCGKELANGQTECEPSCDAAPVDGQGIRGERVDPRDSNALDGLLDRNNTVTINFEFTVDANRVKDAESERQYKLAVHQWVRAVAKAFVDSGLNEFCKKIQG